MTTATKPNGQADEKITALYCRLSVDDDNKDEESNSITNQKQILQDFARKEGYTNTMFFVDDGVSGTTFQRPNFMRMERMAENGEIGTIIVKDLSRFGREQVEMGRLTQVVYPSLGIRFIAIQERVDTLTGDGVEMMPFHNIFNEWYAAQTSKENCAAKSLKRNQEFWRCSNYKDGRGTCQIHYIRDVVLEKIVFEAISGLAEFVKCHETVFLYMLAKKTNAMRQNEHKRLEQTVEQGTKRIAEIDRLIEKVFEQNASGILSDERFSKMLQSYEKEQKALTQEVADSQKTLQEAKQKVTDLRLLLRTLRKLTDIAELIPTLVNSLIERIEVHNNDKSSGHCYVKVDIYFTAAGMIDIPTEQEILAMMQEIRENPQDFRFVA